MSRRSSSRGFNLMMRPPGMSGITATMLNADALLPLHISQLQAWPNPLLTDTEDRSPPSTSGPYHNGAKVVDRFQESTTDSRFPRPPSVFGSGTHPARKLPGPVFGASGTSCERLSTAMSTGEAVGGSSSGSMKRILAAGDCMLGRLVDEAMSSVRATAGLRTKTQTNLGPYSTPAVSVFKSPASHNDEDEAHGNIEPWHSPLAFVWGDTLPLFFSSHLRMVNLETSVTTHPTPAPEQAFNFRMDPANVSVLMSAGVDFCSLANNHILDFQLPGMRQTMRTLSQAGIQHAGCGDNIQEAARPAMLHLDGVPVLCFSAADHYSHWAASSTFPGIFYLEPDRYSESDILTLAEQVRAARAEQGDRKALAVMCIHWGPNYSWHPSPGIRRLAHDFIDQCGFDAVIGTSAHHVQGIEVYNEKPILYGLGDFVDDYRVDHRYRNDLGFLYILHWDASTEAWSHIDLHPTHIGSLQVTLLKESHDLQWLLAKMESLCSEFGTHSTRHNGSLRITVQGAKNCGG